MVIPNANHQYTAPFLNQVNREQRCEAHVAEKDQ